MTGKGGPSAVLWVVAYQVALGLVPPGHWMRLEALVCVWLLLCILTRLSPVPLLKRALVVAPFTLAAAFSPHFPLIALRAWLGLAATLWLVAYVGQEGLLRALETLRVPRLLVATVALTLRYLNVLQAERERMLTAKLCRSAGPPPDWSRRARSTGELAGALLVRTQARSERVYQAMASRGYDGTTLAPKASTAPHEATGMALAASLLLACTWL